jgi:transcriptional regulator with XRE-family HTH domain
LPNDGQLSCDLAKAYARVTREYVSHLERDKYSPTVEVLCRLRGDGNVQ